MIHRAKKGDELDKLVDEIEGFATVQLNPGASRISDKFDPTYFCAISGCTTKKLFKMRVRQLTVGEDGVIAVKVYFGRNMCKYHLGKFALNYMRTYGKDNVSVVSAACKS